MVILKNYKSLVVTSFSLVLISLGVIVARPSLVYPTPTITESPKSTPVQSPQDKFPVVSVYEIAQTQNVQDHFTIEYKQGLITAKIEDIPLERVLSEVQKKTEIKIRILDNSIAGKKVTLSIQNAEPEHFFQALLGENYVLTFKQVPPAKRYALREVWVGNKSLKPSVRTITKEISYGSGRESVGVIRAGEGGSMGPGSFTVDSKGNIYICDTVNNRIQIFSPEGTFVSSIQLKGESPGDISIDKNGFIYVSGGGGQLYQYDSTGKLISELAIDTTRWDSTGPMHIVDNNVYVRGDGRGDVLIAHVENGQLAPPSKLESQKPLQDGIMGKGGKRFIAFPKDNEIRGPAIEVIQTDGTKSLIVIPDQKILSIEFLGEDEKGNSHFQTEAPAGDVISVAVSRFDANGNYIDTIPIPGNSYDFWAIKQIAVGEDGTLYQMMPTKDKLILNSLLKY